MANEGSSQSDLGSVRIGVTANLDPLKAGLNEAEALSAAGGKAAGDAVEGGAAAGLKGLGKAIKAPFEGLHALGRSMSSVFHTFFGFAGVVSLAAGALGGLVLALKRAGDEVGKQWDNFNKLQDSIKETFAAPPPTELLRQLKEVDKTLDATLDRIHEARKRREITGPQSRLAAQGAMDEAAQRRADLVNDEIAQQEIERFHKNQDEMAKARADQEAADMADFEERTNERLEREKQAAAEHTKTVEEGKRTTESALSAGDSPAEHADRTLAEQFEMVKKLAAAGEDAMAMALFEAAVRERTKFAKTLADEVGRQLSAVLRSIQAQQSSQFGIFQYNPQIAQIQNMLQLLMQRMPRN